MECDALVFVSVWAEYFALCANPSALKLTLPRFGHGALFN